MYEYTATVTQVYDGDTITVDVDLGFKTHLKKIKIRLFGINTPEVRGPEKEQGLVSRDWLRERIMGKQIQVKTHKDKTGKYGRWLADIYPADSQVKSSLDSQVKSYNQIMVEAGLAKAATY